MYLYICHHACIHTCVHTYIHTYIHACMRYMHTCIHTCVHTCIHALHTYIRTYIHTYIHTYIKKEILYILQTVFRDTEKWLLKRHAFSQRKMYSHIVVTVAFKEWWKTISFQTCIFSLKPHVSWMENPLVCPGADGKQRLATHGSPSSVKFHLLCIA